MGLQIKLNQTCSKTLASVLRDVFHLLVASILYIFLGAGTNGPFAECTHVFAMCAQLQISFTMLDERWTD